MFKRTSSKARRLLRAAMPATPPPPDFRSSLALRLTLLSPLLLAAAALVALAVFFVNYNAPPAQAQATEVEVWAATLTVKQLTNTVGCDDGRTATGDKCSTTATLDDNDFTYGGQTYRVTAIELDTNQGVLSITISGVGTTPETLGALTFEVGSYSATFASVVDDFILETFFFSTNPGWSVGDPVQLRLTERIQALTASFSPSPDGPVHEDWETNSAHDLWSPTLTVQNLTTTAPAPANRGCDDSQSAARCSSALTDRNFTFKGEAYTVKAISYNQRKVAPDPNNPFNITTYPESLTLTLDKAIPESLRSCLTLHAGGAKIPFADDGVPGAGVDTALSASDSTLTLTEISGNAWGLNWSAGQTVKLRLPEVGCLTLTLSEAVTETTSVQWRIGGTTDQYIPHPSPSVQGADNRQPGTYGDYNYIKLPTFAKGSTTASTPVRPVDDSDAEGCETIILAMTMWPGTDRAVHEKFTVAIQDDDGGNACVGGG